MWKRRRRLLHSFRLQTQWESWKLINFRHFVKTDHLKLIKWTLDTIIAFNWLQFSNFYPLQCSIIIWFRELFYQLVSFVLLLYILNDLHLAEWFVNSYFRHGKIRIFLDGDEVFNHPRGLCFEQLINFFADGLWYLISRYICNNLLV